MHPTAQYRNAEMVSACDHFLAENLSIETVVQAYNIATKHDFESLKTICLNKIAPEL